jgi:hypothetical protein
MNFRSSVGILTLMDVREREGVAGEENLLSSEIVRFEGGEKTEFYCRARGERTRGTVPVSASDAKPRSGGDGTS